MDLVYCDNNKNDIHKSFPIEVDLNGLKAKQHNQKRTRNSDQAAIINDTEEKEDNVNQTEILNENEHDSENLKYQENCYGENDSDNLSTSSASSSIENSKIKHSFVNLASNESAYVNNQHILLNNNSNIFKQMNHQASFLPNQLNYNQDYTNIRVLHHENLTRTSSNASSSSFASSCSSSYSSYSSSYNENNESLLAQENHLKALMVSAANKMSDGNLKDADNHASNTNHLIANFADKFAHIIRSRSNSISESNSPSYNNSELIKQLNSTNASIQNKLQAPNHSPPPPSSNSLSSPVSNKKNNAQNNLKEIKNEETKIMKHESTNAQCKVCGDEASGYHYGVDSCEGCKGFFRRCITQGMNHQCTNNQQCEMTPFSRNSCQFCRLKKCFAVGMSREASRLGRRPKRAKDESNSDFNTTPIKQNSLSEEKNKEANSLLKYSNSCTKQIEPEDRLNAKLKREKSIENLAPFKLDHGSPISLQSQIKQTSPLAKINSLVNEMEVKNSDGEDELIENHTNNVYFNSENNPLKNDRSIGENTSKAQIQKESSQPIMHQIEMLTKLISYTDKYTSIERMNELEYIRNCVIESHLRCWPTTFERIRKRYLERPPSRLIIENNNQKNDNFMTSLIPMITDVVRFCKNIPGFNQIQQQDQIQLLKQGSFEVIIVNSFMLVDAQNRLMLTFDIDYLMDENTVKKIPFGFFMSEIFDLSIQVNTLKLTDAEIALIDALLIMNPDRGDLQDKDFVEELQATILHVLYKHLKHTRTNGSELFLKVLRIIPQVQEINRKHADTINALNLSN